MHRVLCCGKMMIMDDVKKARPPHTTPPSSASALDTQGLVTRRGRQIEDLKVYEMVWVGLYW